MKKYRYLVWLLQERKNKCSIGYKNDDHKIKPLRIMLPKPCACVKGYDGKTKRTHFLIKDENLLETHNGI